MIRPRYEMSSIVEDPQRAFFVCQLGNRDIWFDKYRHVEMLRIVVVYPDWYMAHYWGENDPETRYLQHHVSEYHPEAIMRAKLQWGV